MAFFHANESAEMIMPTSTAKARLCQMMVIAVTTIITSTSCKGILFRILKLFHLKVKNETTIITPVSAAIGINSITGAATSTIKIMASAATTPATRLRAPALILTSVCAIMGQPPMPVKKPFRMLDAPCARLSREPLPLVSVISSTKLSVSSPSVKPTTATMAA